ncbi:hypothetical protein EPN42_10940 [bacterium]|nr:MAG: hypothetical protein EPN42_10940 [bacterium]
MTISSRSACHLHPSEHAWPDCPALLERNTWDPDEDVHITVTTMAGTLQQHSWPTTLGELRRDNADFEDEAAVIRAMPWKARLDLGGGAALAYKVHRYCACCAPLCADCGAAATVRHLDGDGRPLYLCSTCDGLDGPDGIAALSVN